LAQTYPAQEILLIDDGSEDQSFAICREYEKKDGRVRAMTKENSGQADTRNFGIRLAAGEFLLFIDSDDIVSADYVSRLYEMADQTGAKLSVCGFRPFWEEREIVPAKKSAAWVMDREEALESLLYKKEITASPCYRLFHRDVFRKLRFEKGRIFEDLGLMYLAVEAAGRVVYTEQVMYFYRQREGSTMHHLEFTERRLDRIYFSKKILDFVERKYPKLLPAAKSRFFVSNYLVLSELPEGREYRETYQMLKKNLRRYCGGVARDKKAPVKTRLMAGLCCVSVPLTRQAGKFLRAHTSQS